MSSVEEEIDLKLLDTSKLVEEANKLREAKKIARDAEKLEKRLTSSGSSSLITANSADRQSGVLTKDLKAQSRTGAVTGANFNNAFRAEVQKRKKLEQQIKKANKKINDFEEKIVSKLDFANNLIGGDLQTSALSFLGRFGPIGAVIASAVPGIVSLVLDEFTKISGVFSTRLQVRRNTLTINDIDEAANVRSGTKFLTGDLRIVQKAPDTSNTQNLRYEHVRYVMEDLGR